MPMKFIRQLANCFQ